MELETNYVEVSRLDNATELASLMRARRHRAGGEGLVQTQCPERQHARTDAILYPGRGYRHLVPVDSRQLPDGLATGVPVVPGCQR